jgi:hypothetical protein
MKLRIKGSSLRLRLTEPEVQRLLADGQVSEEVCFAAGVQLQYRLRRGAAAQISATYGNNVIEILVPGDLIQRWAQTDLVTLSQEQPLPEGTLRIVVEKDWQCLAPREDEDESDQFPHPRSALRS